MNPEDRRWWEKRRSYLVTPKPTVAEIEEAQREDWARGRVAAAGKDWATHLAKFDGTVLPREVVALPTPSRALYGQIVGRPLRMRRGSADVVEAVIYTGSGRAVDLAWHAPDPLRVLTPEERAKVRAVLDRLAEERTVDPWEGHEDFTHL